MSDVTPGRSSRRARQRRERRQHQVRLIGAVLALLALLAAAFAVYLAASDPEPPAPPASQPGAQRTTLLQVRGADGVGTAGALLAHDEAEQTGAVVLIPPQVLVNVPGTGSMPFGRALAAGSPQGSRDALSDLMGITVQDTWVVTPPALAALVDALGGVAVDVDVQVVQDSAVLLAAGPQRLDGAKALQLLGHLAPGEQEQARLARVQEVLDGVLTALPASAGELTPVLEAMGEPSVSSAPLPELADLLVDLAATDDEGGLQYDVLPVIAVEPGGDVTAFRADTAALTSLVDRLLAGSVADGSREGSNRVLVLNGVGTPGLGEAVRAKLVPAGFVFVGSRNAARFGYAATQVLVPEATPEGQALGERVAAALGLPDAQVATQEFGTSADVIVLVGADFRP